MITIDPPIPAATKTRKKSFHKQLASDAYREAKVASTKLFFTVHCWKKYEILFYSAYWLKWFAVLKNKVICIAAKKALQKKHETIFYSALLKKVWDFVLQCILAKVSPKSEHSCGSCTAATSNTSNTKLKLSLSFRLSFALPTCLCPLWQTCHKKRKEEATLLFC